MATNKILFIPEWKITATTSTPDSGFSKIYPKSDGYWYVVDDSGNEKRLELAIYPKNGLVSTSFSPSNPYGTQLDVSLGSGLTFSGDFVGSTINVSGITPSMLQAIGTPTASYILSTDGTDFTWSPFTSPGISGSTNKIAKFSSNTTLTDSLMSDDGSKVVIGTTPSFAVGLLNVDGDLYASGNLYITDDVNTFATYNQGWLFQTDKNFRITDDLGYKYLNLYSDNISTYTFSILDDKLTMSDNGTFSSLLGDLNLVSIGSTLSTTTFSISSDTQGALQIKDGTEGLNKLFVSDSDGVGSWYNLTSGDAISINGLTISLGITGYGLTISSNLLELDYGIFGSSLTYSTGVVNLPLTGVTAGVYGGTLSSTQLTVDEYGRITEIASYDINFPIYDDYVSSPLDKNAVANDVTVDGGTATNTPISINPIPGSYVAVFVNGQEVQVGNATTNSVCYFGTNSVSPKGFSVSNSIQSGDYLYWNPSIAGYDLESGFRIAFHYLVTPASLSIFGTTGATGPQGPQGATGPQGPQGVTGPTGSAESLAVTLGVGNTTGGNNITLTSGDVINSSSGNALLNLRAGGDDIWIIGNQIATFSQYSGFIVSDGSSLFGGIDLDGWGFSIDNNLSTIGNYDSPTASIVTILPRSVNVVKQSFIGTSSIQSSLAISDISSNTFSFSGGTGEAAVSINSGDGNNTVFNAGVARSVAVGGRGLIVKTDNTAYMNQIALQNITSTFEGILGINTLTSDQTWVFQDKSGFIALTDDILSPNLGLTSIGSSFSVDVNSDSLEISSNKVRLKDSISGDRTFLNSVSINGNLTVLGTTSNIHTENLYVEDNIITLNATFSGSPILNAGIEVNRGTETYSTIIWNESINYWQLGLSGSESTIITEAGSGLSKSNNTLSADYETLANQLSGNGLTANGGVIDVNTSNGLGIISDSVALGGTLSQNTYINVNNNELKLFSSDGTSGLTINDTLSPATYRSSLRYINGSTTSNVFVDNFKVSFTKTTSLGSFGVVISDTSAIISDTMYNKGFVYNDDYSANFTTYSLIDKNYVDTRQFDSLSDVVIGFDTGSASVDDDGKLVYYDFNNSQFTTDEVVTYGTSIINCKTSVLTGTVSKGLPVYITGFDSDLHVVELADASTKNPVIGFTAEQLDDTNSSKVITFGKLTGINTTNATTTLNPNGETWVVGDILYISTTTGGLTKTRPTANTSEIQRVAKVLKVDATGGQLFIFNTFRTAGLPNLKTNYHWVGNGSSIPTNITYSKDITIQEFTRTETLSVREGLLTWLASSSYNGYYITSFIGKVSTLNDNVTYQINRNGIGLTATSNTISSSSGTTITGLSYSISTGDILQIETTSVGVTPSNGLVVSIVMERFI